MTEHFSELTDDLNQEQRELQRYMQARMEWDDRYGNARQQALNWRYMSFLLTGLLILTVMGLVYLGTLPKQAVHVVETDKLGQSVYRGQVGMTGEFYAATEASRRYHLQRFIENVRSLPADTVVVKQQWQDAYNLLTPAAAQMLSTYARKDPPTERLKQERVTLDEVTLIPISDHSWSAQWQETTWSKAGGQQTTQAWKAVFNLIYQVPKTEQALRKNPIGLYIDSFSWTAVKEPQRSQ